jgi:hypothetical protein
MSLWEAQDNRYLLQSLLGRPLVQPLEDISLYLLSIRQMLLPGHALVRSYLCAF